MTFRSRPFDLAVDTISPSEVRSLSVWLATYPRLTMAEETKHFEAAWSKWLGVKYSVMCNSGSSANLLMYAALHSAGRCGRKRIVVPAAGWATTVAPALQLGWEPEMCEVEERTYGLCPESLERLVRRFRPDAVMVVHLLGVPADLTRIRALQRRYGFALLEDCCGAHGARHRGRKVGTFGAMSSFSFYYGHHMSTVEGGVVSTDDEVLYQHLLMLRSHGWLKDLPPRRAAAIMRRHGVDPFHMPFTFAVPGFNVRPTDIAAFFGRRQLRFLDATVHRRALNHRRYQERLAGKLLFAPGLPGDLISSISFCAVARTLGERKRVVKRLVRERIDTRIFTAGNLGRHPFWFERCGLFSAPVADRLYRGGFFLPNNQALGIREVDRVCDTVLDALG